MVGAGAAGLACARTLAAAGVVPVVLERDTAPGGRIRTDEVDGFLLDHGFQVLPRAYPEARRLLDLDRLELHDFARGAIVRSDGRFRRVSDPRESPAARPALARGRRRLGTGRGGAREAPARAHDRDHHRSTRSARPASPVMQSRRSSPPSCEASSWSPGSPRRAASSISCSMPSLPRPRRCRHAAWARSPPSSPRGSTCAPARLWRRSGLAPSRSRTVSRCRAAAVVVATAGLVDEPEHGWNGVTCTYFDAPAAPLPGPWLALNGEGGPINNLCVPSEVAPAYAPARPGARLRLQPGRRRGRPGAGAAAAAHAGSGAQSTAGATCARTAFHAPCRRTRSAARRSARSASRTACTPVAITASTRR